MFSHESGNQFPPNNIAMNTREPMFPMNMRATESLSSSPTLLAGSDAPPGEMPAETTMGMKFSGYAAKEVSGCE